MQSPDEIRDIAAPAARDLRGAGADRHRHHQRRAQPHRHPRPAHPRPRPAGSRPHRRRPGADAAVHAQARGPVRRRRVRQPRPAAPPPRDVPGPGRRHGRGRRPRRHGLSGIFGEMMLTYFAGRGGAGGGDRRLHPRLRPGAGPRSRHLGARRHAQLPCPDRAHPLRGQRADRLRRRAGDARRHRRRRRRRRGGGADRAGRRR